ncbi:MAG: cytochrome c oxidase subunit II, partial [Candidatus Hydrogenedentes bacterium]|nr:cytochrome c oxidase subunit II [Candidatus Hydrogenedentota bacterium]
MSRWFGLPVLASAHGQKVDDLIIYVHLMMFVLLLGWGAFYVIALMKYRKSRSPKADYVGVTSHTSSYLEAVVAVIEAVLLVGLSIPFWMAHVNAAPKQEENPLEVRIVAQQFAWNIHYPGADGKFGRAAVNFVNEQDNPLG